MDESAMIRRAREAIARGDQGAARQLLVRLLHEQPDSETAWMMMATLVEQTGRKRDCLERVLRINPDNDVARAQLAALQAPEAGPEPTSPPEAAPAAEAAEGAPDAALEAGPAVPTEPEAAGASVSEKPAEADGAALGDSGDAQSGAANAEQAPAREAADAVAPQETGGEAAIVAPPPGAGLLPMEPAPEAAMTSLQQPASVTAAVADEAATVLGNSLLIDGLLPGERVLHRTTLTLWVFLGPLAAVLGAAVVVSLPGGSLPESVALAFRASLLVLAFAYFGLRAIRYFGSEFVVTDRRVLAVRGLLARLKVDIPLREIEEVTVGRGALGGSSGSGNVWIQRSDGTQTTFWRIREPGALRDAIERGRAALEDDTETRPF